MKLRTTVLVGASTSIAASLALLIGWTAVAAEPKRRACVGRTPATCVRELRFLDTTSPCEPLSPGIATVEGNTYRLRGQVTRDRSVNIDGFPGSEGWILSTVNSDVDLTTLAGTSWGTFVKLFDNVAEATVYGTYTGVVEGGVFSGRATGRATGPFEGYVFQASIRQTPLGQPPSGASCPGGTSTEFGHTVDATLTIDHASNVRNGR